MHKAFAAGTTLLLLLVASIAPASAVTTAAVDLPTGLGPVSSDNVTYHGTIPIDSPGVGGEVVVREDLGGKKFFYATGGKGLSVYDISDPALPVLTGYLAFPHLQNEDLKVSDDGTKAMIAADGALLVGLMPSQTGIHIVDVTDPATPTVVGSSSPFIRGDGNSFGQAEHTAECANADCTVIYGRTGRIYDASELPLVKEIGRWNKDLSGADVGGIHALNRDESGLVISDSHPRLVLDPRDDPRNPVVLAQGTRSRRDDRLQHNNVRPDAQAWVPRDPDDPADAVEYTTVTPGARVESATDVRPVMRPGEMFIGNSETNLNNNCNAAGGLSTWSMVNFDKGAQLQQLEVFKPLNGNWADGSPARNGLGCSGHWFTENDGYVTASWYEHGVRFFKVDKTVGTIEEVGYFQPVATEAGAAYWVDDEFVYSVDYARGIDIISFDRGADEPTQAELDASWLANNGRVGALAAAERYLCALGAKD